MRHAAHGRLEFSLSRVSARGGEGTRGSDRYRRPDALDPLSDGDQPRRRQQRDAARPRADAEAEDRPFVARKDRERNSRVVEADGRARDDERRSDQPAARFLGIVTEASRELHRHGRFGIGGQLVRARSEVPARDDGIALGEPRDDGTGRAVRDRREVRVSRSGRDRVRRRRRLSDERHERDDHGREVLARVG